jgi:hypothetical protein
LSQTLQIATHARIAPALCRRCRGPLLCDRRPDDMTHLPAQGPVLLRGRALKRLAPISRHTHVNHFVGSFFTHGAKLRDSE